MMERMFEPGTLGPAVRWGRIVAYMRTMIYTRSGLWAEIEWIEACLIHQGKPAAATITASVHTSRLQQMRGQDYRTVPQRHHDDSRARPIRV